MKPHKSEEMKKHNETSYKKIWSKEPSKALAHSNPRMALLALTGHLAQNSWDFPHSQKHATPFGDCNSKQLDKKPTCLLPWIPYTYSLSKYPERKSSFRDRRAVRRSSRSHLLTSSTAHCTWRIMIGTLRYKEGLSTRSSVFGKEFTLLQATLGGHRDQDLPHNLFFCNSLESIHWINQWIIEMRKIIKSQRWLNTREVHKVT